MKYSIFKAEKEPFQFLSCFQTIGKTIWFITTLNPQNIA